MVIYRYLYPVRIVMVVFTRLTYRPLPAARTPRVVVVVVGVE